MPESPPRPFSIIRKLLPYTTVASCIAVLYVAWVFYSRWSQDRQIRERAEQQAAEEARRTYELYGSGQLTVMLFYAVPPLVRRGGSLQLCYSVSNATTVSIDNGVEPIKPSLSRCVAVKPARSTTYTLTAADDKGHKVTKTVDVTVR